MNVIAEQPGYQALLANAPTPEQLARTTPLAPFSPEAVALVDGLSAVLMRSPHSRTYPELVALGYFQAFAGIALPNAASVALHESVGFQALGVYRNVGFKFGAWRDVGWWKRALRAPADPSAPKPFQNRSVTP